MDVGLDFHGVSTGLANSAKALEHLGLLFIEEPILSENPEGLAQIATSLGTPIALGERLYSRWDFKPFFESGAVDIIQPDLSHAGGPRMPQDRGDGGSLRRRGCAAPPTRPARACLLSSTGSGHAERRDPGDVSASTTMLGPTSSPTASRRSS